MRTEAAPYPVAFEAVIIPHRSLSRVGLQWVVGAILVLSTVISVGLWMVGAWPALAFTGSEIALAVLLLRYNARASRTCELLLLSGDGLRIIRTDVSGRQTERVLQPGWLRADLEERPGRAPVLWLADRGSRMEVGAELGVAEKRDLADALRGALYRQQHPYFDNPQLRDLRFPQDPST